MPRPPRAFYHRNPISPTGGLARPVSLCERRLTWSGPQQPGCEGAPCWPCCSVSQMRLQCCRGRRLCRAGALASFYPGLATGPRRGTKGQQMRHFFALDGQPFCQDGTQKWCPLVLWSSSRPVERSRDGVWLLSGQKIRSSSQKRTRSRFAIFAGCGILFPTRFEPCEGGDMVCDRGPLGAYL
jgi:hypothetical protein